jgi:cysteine desulfurase/selenocysteine lyase
VDLQKIRADFPALDQYVWFQNGGVSITPVPVAEAHMNLMRELLYRGPMHIVFPDEEYPRRELTMERLAAFFGVDRGELGLMRGVSEGFQTVLRGLQWQTGDQIVITAEEEAALLLPCLHLRDLYGVEVIKVPLLEDAEEQVQAVSDRLTDRTRLLAFSHVTTDTGFRFPAAEMCALARERGVLSFVDMAHSAGLYPMSLRDIGSDFAGILSYKWMYAPYAAAVLYVDQARLHNIQVCYAGGRAEAWLDFRTDRFELKETTERFQYGPWSWPLVHAWADALDYLSKIGLDAIWERTAALTRRLKAGIQDIPGGRLLTPDAPPRSAALVSFELEGINGVHVRDALRKRWRIVIKAIPHVGPGLRASVPFFLLEDEIDLLIEKLTVLAKECG